VHSWKDNQITEGRLALLKASAMAGAMPGGIAINDAMAVQNLRNPRRVIPCRCRVSSKYSFSAMVPSLPHPIDRGFCSRLLQRQYT
jgi:hypothetical protein